MIPGRASARFWTAPSTTLREPWFHNRKRAVLFFCAVNAGFLMSVGCGREAARAIPSAVTSPAEESHPVEESFGSYIEESNDPLPSAKREGTFDVFDVPATPEDLFVYQVKFAAIGKEIGYGPVRDTVEWNGVEGPKLLGMTTWQLCKAPEENEPVQFSMLILPEPEFDSQIEGLVTKALFAFDFVDYAKTSEYTAMAIQAFRGQEAAKQIGSTFVSCKFNSLANILEFRFQLRKPDSTDESL